MKTFWIIATWVFMVLGSAAAEAAQVSEKDGVIIYKGPVVEGDLERLYEYIYDGAVVEMNSNGGDAIVGIQMYNLFKEYKVTVKVKEGMWGKCRSACAIAALGGENTYGTIALHKAFYPGGPKNVAEEYYLRYVNSKFKTIIIQETSMGVWEGVEKTSAFSFQAVDMFGTAYAYVPR